MNSDMVEKKLFKYNTQSPEFARQLFLTDFSETAKIPTIEHNETNGRSGFVSVLYACCLRSTMNVERLDYKISKNLRKGIKTVSAKKAAAAGLKKL